MTNEIAIKSLENWRRIQHSNITSVREAFTTRSFGDHSLVFVYDYHPLSTTLYAKHFSPEAISEVVARSQASGNPPILDEKLIWGYLIQLSSALKAIHQAGLACRVLEPSKILVCGKNR
jgi:serine/threonine protein kinase